MRVQVCGTPVKALTVVQLLTQATLHSLSFMYSNLYLWAHPMGFYPGTATKPWMTRVLVWDRGRPNGDQHHPLVPVGSVVRGTAATCLTVAVASLYYGPNTTGTRK